MRYKSMPTLNVCTLVVPLFGFTGNLEAAAGMSRVPTQWTIHHSLHPHHFPTIRNNDTALFHFVNIKFSFVNLLFHF